MPSRYLRAILVGLAVSLASGLPIRDLSYDNSSAYEVRNSTVKNSTPTWKIVLLSISGFLAFASIGLIGGACEYVLCGRRKRASDYSPINVDPDCRSIPESSPPKDSDEAMSIRDPFANYEKTQRDEKQDRYSWRDDKGITTEVYMDGAIPGAGPERMLCQSVDGIRMDRGFETKSNVPGSAKSAVQEHETSHGWGGGTVSPMSPEEPQFVVHDEQDDFEYYQEMSAHPGQLVGYYGPATAMPNGSTLVFEPTEAQSTAWDGISVSPLQTAHYSDDKVPDAHYDAAP